MEEYIGARNKRPRLNLETREEAAGCARAGSGQVLVTLDPPLITVRIAAEGRRCCLVGVHEVRVAGVGFVALGAGPGDVEADVAASACGAERLGVWRLGKRGKSWWPSGTRLGSFHRLIVECRNPDRCATVFGTLDVVMLGVFGILPAG